MQIGINRAYEDTRSEYRAIVPAKYLHSHMYECVVTYYGDDDENGDPREIIKSEILTDVDICGHICTAPDSDD